MNKIIRYFISGMGMGAADVVPGISGGTIAFIIGIYDQLLAAIAAFDLHFFNLLLHLKIKEGLRRIHWSFLLPLLMGIVASIFGLAKTIVYILHSWPEIIWGFFFGLIVISAFLMMQKLKWKKGGTWIPLLAGGAAAWVFTGLEALTIGQSPFMLFISGFVAICAMILPGISGSFTLVLLGQYAYVIQAVAEINIPVLAIFSLGCLCGILSFARLAKRLLETHYNTMMAVLTGIMVGALRGVWPWRDSATHNILPQLDSMFFLALAAFLLGVLIPLLINELPKIKKRKPPEKTALSIDKQERPDG